MVRISHVLCSLFLVSFSVIGHGSRYGVGTVTNIKSENQVLDLSDKILDLHYEGKDIWFILFYAPWCSYCARFEPVWGHVAQEIYQSRVRVGKLDCTRYPQVCTTLKVTGYPTIMLLKHGQVYQYHGERNKEDLIHFAYRLEGDPVRQIKRAESLDTVKMSIPIFFSFIGVQEGSIYETFTLTALHYQAQAYFYAISSDVAQNLLSIEDKTAIIVHKDRQIVHYPIPHGHEALTVPQINETLFDWVNEERFQLFPRVTRTSLHQMSLTNKFLVITVVEENKINEIATHELEFKDMVQDFIIKNKAKFHKRFQFCWTGSPDVSHSLIAQFLPTPHLIVVNVSTYEHHIPDDDFLQLTHDALDIFLESIHNNTAKAYGGFSFVNRCYRAYFEAKKGIIDLWQGNPILLCLLFGLPLGFFSLIVYSIFCADILDADETEEDLHEKKE